MATSNTTSTDEGANISQQQLSIILGEIGAMAADLDTLLYAISGQEQGTEAMMRNAARLAGQIEWMADQGMKMIEPLDVMKGDATAWLLPPAYRSAAVVKGGAA